MKVQVIGKSFVKCKDGKSNYSVCHVVYKNPRVEGTCTDTIWVPDSFMSYASIVIDGQYYVDRDAKGYLLDFSAK